MITYLPYEWSNWSDRGRIPGRRHRKIQAERILTMNKASIGKIMKARLTLPVLVVVAVASAGCSASGPGERKYEIPSTLCGVDVSSEPFSTIFPPGETIRLAEPSEYENGLMFSDGTCAVYVDDKIVVSVDSKGSSERISGGGPLAPGIAPYLESRGFGLDIEDSELVEESPHEVRVWEDFAAAHFTCAESAGMDYTGMNVSIDLRGNADRDYSDDLKKIIEPYAEERIARMGTGVCDNP